MKAFSILIIAILFSQFIFGQSDSTGSIQGKITDKANKQPLMFASITIYKAGSEVPETGTETDLDGNYTISSLDTGFYDIKASYTGYSERKITKVKIESHKIKTLNIELNEGKDTGCYFRYVEPLIRLDNTTSGRIYKAEDLRNAPIKN